MVCVDVLWDDVVSDGRCSLICEGVVCNDLLCVTFT